MFATKMRSFKLGPQMGKVFSGKWFGVFTLKNIFGKRDFSRIFQVIQIDERKFALVVI